MANNNKKKTRSETTAKNELAAFCAFWALLIAGILFLVQLILNAVGVNLSGGLEHLIDIIVAIMLGIVIALTAYKYVRGKKKGWKIAYWIMIVLYFVFAICGTFLF